MDERIDPRHLPEAVGEEVWIDVIRKMDEVYNDLLQYEVTLEEKNAKLEESQRFIESVLGSMSDILIVCGRDGAIEEVNRSLVQLTGAPSTVPKFRVAGGETMYVRSVFVRLVSAPPMPSSHEI